MDSSLDGTTSVSLKRIKMSIEEKRQLVHELSKNPDLAFEALQAWTCQDIVEIISLESGKERKYNGLTKAKIINILLKVVTEKKEIKQKKNVSIEDQQEDNNNKNSSLTQKTNSKRRRKNATPSRYVAPNASDSTDSVKTKDINCTGSTKIRFEDVQANSLTLILESEEASSPGNIFHYRVWHRKFLEKDYPDDSTCALVFPNTKFVVSGLSSATEYCFKVVSYSGIKELSVDETKVTTQQQQQQQEKEATFMNCLTSKEEEDRNETVVKEENSSNSGFGLEHCVKLIRQLECSGHLEKSFRQKFLTWYSLRATAQEINVVKTYIDTFKEDSIALAEQLVDTFSDCISKKCSAIGGCDGGGHSGASAAVSARFCMKPRH